MAMKCPYCGHENLGQALFCGYCAKQIREIPEQTETAEENPPETTIQMESKKISGSVLPVVGGILLLITGIFGFFLAVLFIQESDLLSQFLHNFADSLFIPGLYLDPAMIALGVIFSTIVMFGGYFAVQRRRFTLSILAAALSLFVGLFTPFIMGSFLGLISLILIAANHAEFK